MTRNRTVQDGLASKMALDPELDKQVIKERITRNILDQVSGAVWDDVYGAVDAGYERLLLGASITMHIPVLVEGMVRAQERKKQH